MPSIATTGTARKKRVTLALLFVLLGVAAFVVRGYHDETLALHLRDFKQPYASARCLLKGCNPYSEPQTLAVFVGAGGINNDAPVFQAYSALYPPFSFALLTPIAALPYPLAAKVWMALVAALYATAVLLVANLCLPYASAWTLADLAVFALTSTTLMMLGQISGPVISLLVIGFWCLLRERFLWVAVLALTLALCLKPHDSALLVCYLLFAGRAWRRTFALTAVLTVIIVVAGTLWCAHQPASAHWLADLQANLHGNASPGNVNDPSGKSVELVNIANLQTLFAAGGAGSGFYNGASLLVTLLLLGVWSVPAFKMRNTQAKHLLALAGMACIMLLPIYHRQYDTRALLLAFPAVALLLARGTGYRRGAWGGAALGLVAIATVVTSHQFLGKLTGRVHDTSHLNTLETVLVYRPIPLITLILAVFFVAAFVATYRKQQEQG